MEMLAILGVSAILGWITSAAVEGYNEQQATAENTRQQGYYEKAYTNDIVTKETEIANEKQEQADSLQAAKDLQSETLKNNLNELETAVNSKKEDLATDYENSQNYLATELANALSEDAAKFALNKQAANEEVDKTELTTDQSERSTAASYNEALSDLSLSQSQRASSYNSAAMQAGATKGSELAAIGNSGIRAGSSLSQAVELESAVNAALLQQEEDAQRKSDSNQLSSLFNSLGNAQFELWNARDTADKTRASWEEGGYNYELDQLQKQSYQNDYDLNLNKLNDSYNSSLKQLNDSYNQGVTGYTNNYNTAIKSLENTYNSNITSLDNSLDLYKTSRKNQYDLQIQQLNDEYDDYMSTGSQWSRLLSGTFNFGSGYASTINSLKDLDLKSALSDIKTGDYTYSGSYSSASSLLNTIKNIKIGG